MTAPSFPEPEQIATHAVIDWHDRLGRPVARYRSAFAHPTRMMPALADYMTDASARGVVPSPEDFYRYAADRMLIDLDDARTRDLPMDSSVAYHYRVVETVDFGSAPTDPNLCRAAPRTLQVVVQVRTSTDAESDLSRAHAPWNVLMRTYTTSELYMAAGTVLYHQGLHERHRRDGAEAADLIARAAAYARLGRREERI